MLFKPKIQPAGSTPQPKASSSGIVMWLVLSVVLVNVFVVFIVVLLLRQSHLMFEQTASIEARNLAHTLSDSIGDDIDKIDAAFQVVVDEYEKAGWEGVNGQRLNAFLDKQQRRVPIIEHLWIADNKVNVRYGLGTAPATGTSIDSRESFVKSREDTKFKLRIGGPVQLQASRQWVLPFSRRINRADGAFAGVVYAQVAVRHFSEAFSHVNFGLHGGISLRDESMGIITRYPAPNDLGSIIGNRTLSPELRKLFEAGKSAGTFYTPLSWDNTAKVVSYHKVGDYPLYVNVGLASEDYLTEWRAEALKMSLLVAVFFLLTAVSAWSIYRSMVELKETAAALRGAQEQLEEKVKERTAELNLVNEQLSKELVDRKKAEESLQKSEQRLTLHARQTLLAMIEWDTSFHVVGWNAAAEKIFGHSSAEAMGRHAEFIVPVDARPHVDHIWNELLLRKGGERSTNENVTKDNRTILCEWYNTPLITSDRKVIGVASLVQDVTEQKRAETLLRQREVQLKESQRLGQIGSWEWDAATDRIWWSDEYYRIFGFDPSLPTPNYEEQKKVYTQESSDRLDAAVKRAMEAGEPYELDLELAQATETTRWIVARGETLRDTDGKITGLRGTAQNITSRKRGEEELKRLSLRTEMILDSAGEGIYGADTGGNIVFMNHAALTLLGYPVGEVLGKNSHFLFHHTRSDGTPYPIGECPLHKSLVRGESFRGIDDAFWTRDNTMFPVEHVNTPLIVNGEVTGAVVVFRDISERKRFEEALHTANAYNRRLIEASLDPLVMISPEGTITDVNAATEAVTGYAREYLVGTDFCSYFTDPASARTGFERAFRDGSVHDYALEIRNRDGRVTSVLFNASVYLDKDGGIAGVFAAARDVSERKKNEEQLRMLNEELESRVALRTGDLEKKGNELKESQAALMNIVEDLNDKTAEIEAANEKLKDLDRLKSMFIASMSHELRTPLNSIIGFSSIMLNEWTGPVTQEQKDNLSAVLRSGKHLLSLINDVIDVSKIEAGKLQPLAEEFDVRDVVAEALQSFSTEVQKKGLSVEVCADHHILRCDRRRLLQCLLNLISNAIKYTDKGSIMITAGPAGESVFEISVSDTGIGIRPEDMQNLFSPFFRIVSPQRAVVAGTGLGLYLTRKLAQEVLRGDILVSSRFGEGSRFTLTMPVADPGRHS